FLAHCKDWARRSTSSPPQNVDFTVSIESGVMSNFHHQYDEQPMEPFGPAPNDFVGLNGEDGQYYFFHNHCWYRCPDQNPPAIALALAIPESLSMSELCTLFPTINLDLRRFKSPPYLPEQPVQSVENLQSYYYSQTQHTTTNAEFQVRFLASLKKTLL